MRLIDADALKLSMMLIAPGETKKYCYPCKEILKAIDDAPTIEERKTGTQKTFSEMVHLHDAETHIPYPDQIIDIVSEVPLVQPIDGQGIKECMARLKKVNEEERDDN